MNTYDWIIATADSNINNIINTNIDIIIMIFLFVELFPNKDINKCPAIIFAVNRTAKDPGRIIFLVVSIITINGINTAGVPIGTRWDIILFVLFSHPNIINVIHIGIDIVNENTKCDGDVKT